MLSQQDKNKEQTQFIPQTPQGPESSSAYGYQGEGEDKSRMTNWKSA